MNELVQRLIDKAGLSEDQAASAVQAVAGFLKERLPAPVAAQVDNVLGGGGAEATSGVGASLGGMFGKG